MQEKRKRIYISGPMTGLDPDVMKWNFTTASMEASLLGYIPVNPAVISELPLETEEYMILDIELLGMCDAIYMLRGWENSNGANIELETAMQLGMRVLYQSEEMEREDNAD
ncbi:MAG: DUF4406 domain-containing protein [Eubacterium sp.]|nr:DUF4406 domain-containing protein [Candidatus Colimonas fimequi]